jgi:type IV pilus assembly protein PilC
MLSRLLNRATQYLRDEQEIVRKVRGALVYPAIMFSFALGTTIFLLTFVLPRFSVIYAGKKAALPVPTQVLIWISDYLVANWMGITAALVTSLLIGSFYLRTRAGTELWHYVQLQLPLLGKLYRKLHLARGLRMVGTMAGAGVALLDCVNIAHELCPNNHFKHLWKRIADQIQTGRAMSEPLFESDLVPRSVAQMVFSGEKSGKLAQVMEQVSTYAEDELKEQVTSLTRYIEPLMILVMGVIIGGVALALLLPVFTISRVMAR